MADDKMKGNRDKDMGSTGQKSGQHSPGRKPDDFSTGRHGSGHDEDDYSGNQDINKGGQRQSGQGNKQR